MSYNELNIANITDFFNIPTIKSQRQYWLVRTNSGEHYDDFIQHDYIALGWNYISLSMIKNYKEEDIKKIIGRTEALNPSLKIADDEDEEDNSDAGKVTTIYNKIHRFVNEFSIDDVVLIPSKNSTRIAIGIIQSDVYEDTTYFLNYYSKYPDSEAKPCPYYKRRNVNWVKGISKSEVDIYLLKAFSSHHSISNIDDCAPFINRTLHDFYAINDEVHATFHAGHPNGMSFYELRALVDCLTDILDDIQKDVGINFKPDDIKVKLNIHSPGLIEIAGATLMASAAISMVIFAINHYFHGGKTNYTFKRDATGKIDFSISSESKGAKEYKLEKHKFDCLLNLQKSLDMSIPEMDTKSLTSESESSVEE